jgi:hypothetical protein
MDYGKIKEAAQNYQEDMVKFLRAIVKNPGESCDERKHIETIEAEMKKLNFDEVTIDPQGNVIGYMGHTGYSAKENVNNIETVHLHFGLQLIFDESQKEGNNEIWIDCYDLTRFLYKNRSLTEKNVETREWFRTFHMKDPSVSTYLQLNPDAPVLNNGN